MPDQTDSLRTMTAILDAAADGILTIDDHGLIESANRAALAMFGYTRAELVGLNVKVLMPPPYRGEHDGYLARYLGTRDPHIIGQGREVEGQRKDGSAFPLHLSVGEAELADRRVFTGILHDVSAHRSLQEAERRALGRTRAVVDAAVDAVATIDERGTIEAVNPALEKLFGYERDELIGRNVKMLMPTPYRDEHDGYLAAYRETGVRRIIGSGREVEGRRRDGSVFPMYLSVSKVKIGDDRWFAGNMHDLTAQKALETQLLQSQKMEAVGALAGGVAHDFNNLLTAILGSAQIASGHAEPGTPLARSLDRIKLAADRGEALTKQLLAFSRQQVTRREPVDLNEAVRSVRELFERMIGEDIQVQLDLDPEAGVVDVDPGQFDQVVINLVVNARDAMPQGGKLTLATRLEELDPEPAAALGLSAGSHVSLSVTDTGIGIPEEFRHKIFEPFFTTKEEGRGTGLGLSTAHGIIHGHGGAIDVQSCPTGTTFRLVFPRVADRIDHAPEAPDPAAEGTGAARTILLVEDDDLMRGLVVEVLELEGYHVCAAGAPEEALELARDRAVDLLITDVVMPQLTGFELVARLRETGRTPLVLFISGYTDQILADRGELGPDDAFLRKPFGNDELIAKIAETLQKGPSGRA